jgi:hypothetical protein
MILENKDSGIPLLNIGEFLFNTKPELKNVTHLIDFLLGSYFLVQICLKIL